MRNSIELGLIGNCRSGALIDANAEVAWWCLPGFDGDPAFCSLLREHGAGEGFGYCALELVDQVKAEQAYIPDSPILLTRLFDAREGIIEVTDFAPRFRQFARIFSPLMIVRRIRRVQGSPRLVVRVRPVCDYGRSQCTVDLGSDHIRFVGRDWAMRLTTDASVTDILDERPSSLKESVTMIFASDETITEAVDELARRYEYETLSYWHGWVRGLAIPFEWQDAVIRAAITLKLNTFEDTGAIIAAMTTSIPEAPDTSRNWDYRYCWLRDASYVINALNRLGTTRTMERYVEYLVNIVGGNPEERIQPVYTINGRARLDEKEVDALPGYRGMGPVRVGNQACEQVQHDVYGAAILAVAHIFFDRRLVRNGDPALFSRLEPLGEMARSHYNQPDAGIWELRGASRTHTFSSVMCWAACDRLARIAAILGINDRATYWRKHADWMHAEICSRAWNKDRQVFTSVFDSHALDACLLLLHDLGFVAADDPRFRSTVDAIGHQLRKGDYIYRYLEPDDFGVPENAFVVCTFWYISALRAVGRIDEARELFEHLLSSRNRLGLLAEHIDPRTGEQWGNFVQTYSMAGLINSAIRLSRPWEHAF